MTPSPILLTKKQSAALLNISVGMLDKLTRQGRIEPVRLSKKKVLFRRDDVERLALTPRQRRIFTALENAAVCVQ